MKKELKAAWTAKLRSGEIPQGRIKLHEISTGRMCCLGVLCNVAGIKGKPCEGYDRMKYVHNHCGFGYELQKLTGLTNNRVIETLMNMNDSMEHGEHANNFSVIADWIDENIECE